MMKALIIEDEQPIAIAIENLLLSLRPGIEILGVAADIPGSIKAVKDNPNLDIIFSDIKIDDGLSFSVFDNVETNAMIVFTTAYDNYALKAFDYNCVDYLLKPVSPDALERALSRCEQRLPHVDTGVIRATTAGIIKEEVEYRNRIFLYRGNARLIISSDEICFIFTERGNTRAFLTNGMWGSTECSLIEFSQSLNPKQFCRINRQTIVNINFVKSITRGPGRDSTVFMKAPFDRQQFKMTAERKKELLSLYP